MNKLIEGIMHFKFAKFQIGLTAGEKGLNLPEYKGFSIRGGFGNAFRRLVCDDISKKCIDCFAKEECPYSYIFETSPPEDALLMKKFTSVPRPYIIEPPMDKKTYYASGEKLCFNLILIGNVIKFLPYFIFAFDRLGDIGIGKGKGRFFLEEVYSIDSSGNERTLIYSLEQKKIFNKIYIITAKDILESQNAPVFQDDQLVLQFKTPIKIQYQGRLAEVIEFPILMGNLVRRFSNLSFFHMDREIRFDYEYIVNRAKEVRIAQDNTWWSDLTRYSYRQNRRMKMGGLVGSITYKGDMRAFLPLLILGESIHVGKNTVMGFGKYEILRW